MFEQLLNPCNKLFKNQDCRKANQAASEKHSRKGENPARVEPPSEQQQGFQSTSWVCKNSACRVVLSLDESFCRRCSCYICHLFDDNKDPSLWLVCESDSQHGESCGVSCHLQCALQEKKAGVVNLGQFMELDGSYCCASCGEVSGILGYWKKQLSIAKEACHVDALCYRIHLSYRLLNGTARFRELHRLVCDAKEKLEDEVGAIDGDSIKMSHDNVSQLLVAADVQRLCSDAIQKADEWIAMAAEDRVDSLPSACRFLFEEITSSSLVLFIIELPIPLADDIKGYKLWFCESRQETFSTEPIRIFPKEKRRITVTDLLPCTEYKFRIVSYSESGDLGPSEAKCLTKSVGVVPKTEAASAAMNDKKDIHSVEGSSSTAKGQSEDTMGNGSSPGTKVRDLGKIPQLARSQDQVSRDGSCSDLVESCFDGKSNANKRFQPRKDHQSPPVSRDLDLNVVLVPDLNEDLVPSIDYYREEDDQCRLERPDRTLFDSASHRDVRNARLGQHGNGASQGWADHVPNGEASRKRVLIANEETLECDSTLVNGRTLGISAGQGNLDENFESCVKAIRRLECQGYIGGELRSKLLTWFSLRSTEQERRVVNTFIRTLSDDPKILASQLVDSFYDIVSSKRQRNGVCN